MASCGAARSCVQRALQACQQRGSLILTTPPTRPFLATPLAGAQPQQIRFASASIPLSGPPLPKKPPRKGPVKRRRPNRDHNKQRGLSAMRQTGPREGLSVSGLPLPRPVSPEEFKEVVKTDPAHGLWDFFYERGRPLNEPRQDRAHGRAWQAEELRRKGWEDLHRLWWVCVKERNRIATGNWERKKGEYGYGDVESRDREMEVRKTQNAIKHVLTERFYAWEDAVKLAKNDAEIEFTKDGTKDCVKYVRQVAHDKPAWEDEAWEDEEPASEDEEPATDKTAVDPSIPPNGVKSQQDAPRA